MLIADISADAARRSAERVNALMGSEVAHAQQLDVTDRDALVAFLKPIDSFLSAVPYWNTERRAGHRLPGARTLWWGVAHKVEGTVRGAVLGGGGSHEGHRPERIRTA